MPAGVITFFFFLREEDSTRLQQSKLTSNKLRTYLLGAKGLTMWDFPTTEELSLSTMTMASLFTATDAPGFLIGAPRHQDLAVAVAGGGANIDAAAWVDQASGRALVSVVSLDYEAVAGPVTISLPDGVLGASVADVLWGSAVWDVGQDGTVSVAEGLGGLGTTVFLVNLE